MADAAVAADLGQALDIQGHGAAQVALHHIAMVNGLTQLGLICLGQILDAGVGVDPSLRQNILGALSANAIDVSQTDLDSLILGQVNTGNSCHLLTHLQFHLALSLLVLGILADDHDAALPANDLALLTHGLNGRSYFHVEAPPTYYAR